MLRRLPPVRLALQPRLPALLIPSTGCQASMFYRESCPLLLIPCAGSHCFRASTSLSTWEPYRAGQVYGIDAASAAAGPSPPATLHPRFFDNQFWPVHILDPQPGDVVLDLCCELCSSALSFPPSLRSRRSRREALYACRPCLSSEPRFYAFARAEPAHVLGAGDGNETSEGGRTRAGFVVGVDVSAPRLSATKTVLRKYGSSCPPLELTATCQVRAEKHTALPGGRVFLLGPASSSMLQGSSRRGKEKVSEERLRGGEEHRQEEEGTRASGCPAGRGGAPCPPLLV
eukprot:46340-Hanusia_phi.AAC.6